MWNLRVGKNLRNHLVQTPDFIAEETDVSDRAREMKRNKDLLDTSVSVYTSM